MNSPSSFQLIQQALEANNLPEAHRLIDIARQEWGEHPALLCLQGKAYLKMSHWAKAQSCFMKAQRLEPEGPARQYNEMLADIMNFYQKDLYNP